MMNEELLAKFICKYLITWKIYYFSYVYGRKNVG